MNNPLISIIIPCYNNGHFLQDAINSALAQTYRNLEIIVIDDGSTDETKSVAEKFKNVGYYYQENRGLPAARNLGIKKMSGDFFVSLDADDTLHPQYTERLLRAFNGDANVAFTWCQAKIFGTSNFTTNYPEYSLKKQLVCNNVNAAAMIRVKILSNTLYDESMVEGWEDWDLYLSIAEKGYVGRLVNEALYNYRFHESPHRLSNQIQRDAKKLKILKKIILKHRKLYDGKSVEDAFIHHKSNVLDEIIQMRAPGTKFIHRVKLLYALKSVTSQPKTIFGQLLYTLSPRVYFKYKRIAP